MNKAAQFQLCLDEAKRIVGAYRSEAPLGYDPQNTWVAIGVGVAGIAVSAGTSAYQSSQQKKAASQAASASSSSGGGSVPSFVPVDWNNLEAGAANADKVAYTASDNDFARRHPELLAGEHAFEQRTAEDQQGNTQFIPQMQSEAVNAGLGSALNAFGDQTGTLQMGGAGEADVAKNLGLSVLGFQQQNRTNAASSLSLAEQLFPRRQIGLSGQDFASTMIGNVSGQNSFNEANYAAGQAAAGRAQSGANATAQAQAQASAAQAQLYGSLAQSAVKSGGQAYGSYTASHPSTPTTTGITTNWQGSAATAGAGINA